MGAGYLEKPEEDGENTPQAGAIEGGKEKKKPRSHSLLDAGQEKESGKKRARTVRRLCIFPTA